MQTSVKLTPKGLKWLKTGHLWIYREDIASGADESLNGEVVRVESSAGTFLAQAFYSYRSTIALRIISLSERPPDREYFRTLITGALGRRGEMFGAQTACRLASAEGDLFPGLIVDHYAGHLVAQILIPGVEKLKAILVDILKEVYSPRSITLRCDATVREMEGLPLYKEMAAGEPQHRVEVQEGTARYLADLWDGHKTGAYLDQQANRLCISRWARGRALDAFCYHGHFSLHLARECDEVVAMDSSDASISRLRENCELNGLANVTPRKAKVFEALGEMQSGGELFDIIILDPPPFARSRKDLSSAGKGYGEINRRALRLLKPGGILATYSCSYNLAAERFLEVLRKAAADVRRKVQVTAYQFQSPDHPILLTVPETHYLKGLILEVLD